MRVLVIGGVSRSLVNFRGPLLEAMRSIGHQVSACAGEASDEVKEQLRGIGVEFFPVELQRRGTSLWGDLNYSRSVTAVIRETKPDVVLAYTIKPVVYGCRAAVELGVPTVAAMITGAGAAQGGIAVREKVISWIARRLYRRTLRKTDIVFFQNPDDESLFRNAGIVSNCRIVQIPGSGVDLTRFAPVEVVNDPVTFLLIARMLVKKGVREYVAAARRLKESAPGVRCLLVGPIESGGGCLSADEITAWHHEGVVEYLGELADVRSAMAQASVYVLPSYYGEGTPRTVLEAMAMGRPIITTDAPGCRETVVPNQNGFLIPTRDPEALARAMERFVHEPSLIRLMGEASRAIAEEKFDVNKVNDIVLRTLGLASHSASVGTA